MAQDHMDITVRTSFHYWTAIASGALIGSGVHLTMGVLGLALGLYVAGPGEGQPLSVVEIPMALGWWWWLSSVVALFAAGAAAGVMVRSADLRDATILGATVWALAVLFSAWIATTTIGAALSGSLGVLLSRSDATAREIRVVVEGPQGTSVSQSVPVPQRERSAAPTAFVPPASRRTAEDQATGTFQKAIETMSWSAVLLASRQLEKPEVRETLRQYAKAAWDETQDIRSSLAERISRWFESEGEQRADAAIRLRNYVMRTLLLTAEDAERLINQWRDTLGGIAPDRPGAVSPPETTRPDESQPVRTVEEVRAEVREKINQIASALEQVRSEMVRLIGKAGFPEPADRAAALERLRAALATTEQDASRILENWQRKAEVAASELRLFAGRAARTAEDQTQAALSALSQIAGWVAISLLFGWVAATGGAFAGGHWASRDPGEPTQAQDIA